MSEEGPEFNPAMRPDEPLTPFDVTRTSERAGLLKLVIGFGLLLVLAFIVMKLYQPGVRDRGDPPLITAENTPFKIVPEDTQGTQTPDQDKEVFDIMSGEDPSTDVITLPPPETPVDLPVAENDPVTIDMGDTDFGDTDTTVSEPVVADPEPAPIIEQPRNDPPALGSSDWIVQVASLRSQAEADRTYAAIRSRHSGIIEAYAPDIVRVDLGEKGIYYRARVSGFASRADANATCERLKAAGQSCFVARR